MQKFSLAIRLRVPETQILFLAFCSFKYLTRYSFIQVTHFLNAFIRDITAMFFQHRVDFISDTILNVRVQRQLVKTEAHGCGGGFKSSSKEHECLCCYFFHRKCSVACEIRCCELQEKLIPPNMAVSIQFLIKTFNTIG